MLPFIKKYILLLIVVPYFWVRDWNKTANESSFNNIKNYCLITTWFISSIWNKYEKWTTNNKLYNTFIFLYYYLYICIILYFIDRRNKFLLSNVTATCLLFSSTSTPISCLPTHKEILMFSICPSKVFFYVSVFRKVLS